MQKPYTKIKFKISALIWNEKFDLSDGSYSVLDVKDYFEYILKSDNISITIYVNQIENRITFKIKDIISNF